MELRTTQLRKKKGLTQAQLAELCSTTQQQIAKLESSASDPQLSTLKKIAQALECEVRDLFYSKELFLDEVRSVVKEKGINLKKATLLELNSICSHAMGTPSFHPYWELLVIKNGNIFLKEKK